ncbi:hypothetical protein GCM10011579_050760 [Streptomyces albiflavescens]|uniref:Uncharacterized protein n=1 Tax=Streptomyces albiflavescens TaxID=1623582 RepID=A0A917Y6A4_9ACTN|nr:hypothetical protein GCM10011579_050760 [Streptomyces albiflavescens]
MKRCRSRKTTKVGRMTSTAPAEIVSQCAPKDPMKRNSDVEITPRSSDDMERNGMEKSL